MQTSDGGRYGGSPSSAYSPNLKRPGRASRKRTALKIALCLLLPPLGLLWIWRTGSFALRGRILTSVLACASLCLMCLPLFQPGNAPTTLPQPVAPVAVTRAPEEDTTTALGNIEELLAQQEAGVTEAAPAQPQLTDEQIYNTIVYSVFNNAENYHAGPTCGDQQNGRTLTVRQALDLSLTPCPNCNPVVPSTYAQDSGAQEETAPEETQEAQQ